MGIWWSSHTHSNYSVLDGMTPVDKLVRRAAALEQPALGITDHGNMASATALYTGCRKAGIKPFPGVEAYLIEPSWEGNLDDKGTAPRLYHVGLLALDADGYTGLVKAISLAHTRPRFSRFPRFTFDDLIEMGEVHGEHIAVMTGCFFGYVQQALVHGDQDSAVIYVEALHDVFPHVFMELQNHDIDHTEEDPNTLVLTDDELVRQLYDMAGDLKLPVLATADSHYFIPQDKKAHALMKQMVYGGVEDAFPGDSFHLPDEEWVADHYHADVWQDCLAGSAELLELNKLSIPALDSYRPRVPTLKKNAQTVLTQLCAGALRITPQAGSTKYYDRLQYELGVISQLKQANYLLLWDVIVKWCRSEGICIEARGSANGSLVCYLLGITQVDPIKYGVTFDRFLSTDRIKPPDIDMDIEDVSRQRLIGYLKKNFNLVAIGTWAKLGTSINEDGDEKGSVLVTFKAFIANGLSDDYEKWRTENKDPGKKIRPTDKKWEAEIAEDKKLVYAGIRSMKDVKEYFDEYYTALRRISAMGSVYKSYGTHAGGLLLDGDDLKIEDWIPTMLVASSDTTVSQPDMDAVEQWGLLKLDVLGQRSLTILRLCQQYMGRKNPTDFSWIPDNDHAALKIISEGHVGNGVFHAEGFTKAIGYRKMKPKSVGDVILGTALFMPGAQDTGQTDHYLQRRFSKDLRDNVYYPHDVFRQVLGKTYGALVFQEQTLNIMRGLGLDMATINMMFKIVKDSGKGAEARNRVRIKPIRDLFDQACAKNGVEVDADGGYDEAWNWITGIVAYAFNQAHATGYGIRTYRFAYLKANHSLEFHAALLEANAGTPKEADYLKEVRRMKIPIMTPHVNDSGIGFTINRKLKAIRKGLLSIPGIGLAGATCIADNAPYTSVTDLCTRAYARGVSGRMDYLKDGTLRGTVLALSTAGALSDLPA